MTAKELMLGDWVNINGDRPMYSVVTSLNQGEVGVCNYLFSADVLLPIPLTPEILEKNGFKQIEDGIQEYDFPDGIWQNDNLLCGLDYNHNGMFYTFSNNPEDDGLINQICGTFYVHTLQHALRLCGLDELADSLKV